MPNLDDNAVFLKPADIVALSRGEMSLTQRQIVNTVNRRVASAASLDAVMDFLFETTRDICPCDRLGLAFVEDGGQRVKAYYAKARYEPMWLKNGYTEDLSANSLGAVVRGNWVRLIRDLEDYGRRRPASHSTQLLLREGVRSSMTCPLSVDGRNVGVFFRSSREKNSYGPEQARLFLAIAERLSQAVEKSFRIHELQNANRAYMEMLSFVAHELKTPVASLVSDAQILAGGYLGEVSEPQRKKLEAIARKGNMLLNLTRDYLELARLEEGGVKARIQLDLALDEELFAPCLELVQAHAESRAMRIEHCWEKDQRGDFDPGLMRIVVGNLLNNAIKYGREGGTVRLKAREEPGRTRISVWNEGPGFTEENKALLFRKFSRLPGESARKVKGTGVGLYNCWRILKMHGGQIWAESEPGEWAEFLLDLPRRGPQHERPEGVG